MGFTTDGRVVTRGDAVRHRSGNLTDLLSIDLSGPILDSVVTPDGGGYYMLGADGGVFVFGTADPDETALARRLNLPFRSGGSLTASKIEDAQAAYESADSMHSTMLAGANFVLHAAGWMEGGLCTGFEKLVMDADRLGAYQVMLSWLATDENALGRIYTVCDGLDVTWSRYLGDLAAIKGIEELPHADRDELIAAARLHENPEELRGMEGLPTLPLEYINLAGYSNRFDCTRVREELGWRPDFGYEEALEELRAQSG